jgi:hypothetical protein
VRCYQHALSLFTELGARHAEAGTCTRLGDARLADGDHAAACAAWRRALAIFDDLHHPHAERVRARLEAA